jgi:hypothetical protein
MTWLIYPPMTGGWCIYDIVLPIFLHQKAIFKREVCKRYDLDPSKIYTNDDAWEGPLARQTIQQDLRRFLIP